MSYESMDDNGKRKRAPVPPSAWRALFAGQLGWMLDAFDFLLFTFALRAIQKEFGASSATMGLLHLRRSGMRRGRRNRLRPSGRSIRARPSDDLEHASVFRSDCRSR